MDSFTTDVEGCARCRKNHRELRVRPLTLGESALERYTHWAICPTNGEPLFFRMSASGESGIRLQPGSCAIRGSQIYHLLCKLTSGQWLGIPVEHWQKIFAHRLLDGQQLGIPVMVWLLEERDLLPLPPGVPQLFAADQAT
jgi:hypothetical protein